MASSQSTFAALRSARTSAPLLQPKRAKPKLPLRVEPPSADEQKISTVEQIDFSSLDREDHQRLVLLKAYNGKVIGTDDTASEALAGDAGDDGEEESRMINARYLLTDCTAAIDTNCALSAHLPAVFTCAYRRDGAKLSLRLEELFGRGIQNKGGKLVEDRQHVRSDEAEFRVTVEQPLAPGTTVKSFRSLLDGAVCHLRFAASGTYLSAKSDGRITTKVKNPGKCERWSIVDAANFFGAEDEAGIKTKFFAREMQRAQMRTEREFIDAFPDQLSAGDRRFRQYCEQSQSKVSKQSRVSKRDAEWLPQPDWSVPYVLFTSALAIEEMASMSEPRLTLSSIRAKFPPMPVTWRREINLADDAIIDDDDNDDDSASGSDSAGGGNGNGTDVADKDKPMHENLHCVGARSA